MAHAKKKSTSRHAPGWGSLKSGGVGIGQARSTCASAAQRRRTGKAPYSTTAGQLVTQKGYLKLLVREVGPTKAKKLLKKAAASAHPKPAHAAGSRRLAGMTNYQTRSHAKSEAKKTRHHAALSARLASHASGGSRSHSSNASKGHRSSASHATTSRSHNRSKGHGHALSGSMSAKEQAALLKSLGG